MACSLEFDRPEDVRSELLPSQPYFITVSADFGAMNPKVMRELADLLVKTNAMWVAAHGNQGTQFDDAVDEAYVLRNIEESFEYPQVMTTWHDDEPLFEVVGFLEMVTPHEEWADVKDWSVVVLRIRDVS